MLHDFYVFLWEKEWTHRQTGRREMADKCQCQRFKASKLIMIDCQATDFGLQRPQMISMVFEMRFFQEGLSEIDIAGEFKPHAVCTGAAEPAYGGREIATMKRRACIKPSKIQGFEDSMASTIPRSNDSTEKRFEPAKFRFVLFKSFECGGSPARHAVWLSRAQRSDNKPSSCVGQTEIVMFKLSRLRSWRGDLPELLRTELSPEPCSGWACSSTDRVVEPENQDKPIQVSTEELAIVRHDTGPGARCWGREPLQSQNAQTRLNG
ncbi:hypothetical protein AC579_6196 [Pseudocercospora musae]|uniref:Uncharacterized protein n=1 Tax=Pseudocercospora musae TaxID=113226 RepID=A0A139ISK4_9PEZI|nr:hypothetical protein AC579_6196 [Pseudocercospora musae]